MLANVGDDAFGKDMIDNFQKQGVNTQLVRVVENESSGVATILVADDGSVQQYFSLVILLTRTVDPILLRLFMVPMIVLRNLI